MNSITSVISLGLKTMWVGTVRWRLPGEQRWNLGSEFFTRGSLGILSCGIRLSDRSVPRHFTYMMLSHMEMEANPSSE